MGHDVLNDALAGSVLQQAGLELEEGEVGLSAEDFEAAQQALQEKIKRAEEKIEDVATPKAKKKPPVAKPKPGPKTPAMKKAKKEEEEKKKEQQRLKEEQKEQQRMEKIVSVPSFNCIDIDYFEINV